MYDDLSLRMEREDFKEHRWLNFFNLCCFMIGSLFFILGISQS
jgi:hypothetical protein